MQNSATKGIRPLRDKFSMRDAGAGYFGGVMALIAPQFILAIVWNIGVAEAKWPSITELQRESFAFMIISGLILQILMLGFYILYTRKAGVNPISAPRIVKMPLKNWALTAAAGVIALFGLMFTSHAFDLLFTDVFGYKGLELPAFDTAGKAVLGIITMGLIPAVVEELIFRGMVLRGLSPLGKWKAVLISAAAFTLMHMNPSQTVHQFLLGIIMALIAWETGSILAPMLIHFINNALAIILEVSGFSGLVEKMTAWEIVGAALVTLAAVCGIMYFILRFIKKPEGGTEIRDIDGNIIKRKLTDEHNALAFLLAGFALAAVMWLMALIPDVH